MHLDISQTVLQTPRLTLRFWREDDLNDFFEYASVPGVGEWAGWLPHESIEVSRRILAGWPERKNVFAIALRENDKVIGSLGLHDSWAEQEEKYAGMKIVEIGYMLGKPYWDQGLMTEAVRKTIEYLFDEAGMDAIPSGILTITTAPGG